MIYLIGDLQGCATRFDRNCWRRSTFRLRATAVVLGDLVNRGPDSRWQVLQRLAAWATRHLPAGQPRPAPAGRGPRRAQAHRSDTFAMLAAPDAPHG
jgi:hypothetical protein